MDDDVKNYHLHPLDQSLPAVEFLSQRQRGKMLHRREPLAVLVDEQIPLKASEVGKSKPSEDGCPSPVNVFQGFLLGNSLDQYICRRRLDGRNGELSQKGTADW